jgi:hypothetical protein
VFRLLIPADDGGKSAALAARSSIFAATSDVVDRPGIYIDTNSEVGQLHASVHDASNQRRVMEAIRG